MLDDSSSTIAAFLFKGQVAAETVRPLTEVGRRSADIGYAEISGKVAVPLLDADLVSAAQKMSAVYVAIASFENGVRDLVSSILLEKKGADWWNSSVSNEVKKRAESRQKQEEKIRWHQARGLGPIYYVELGDTVAIIQGNWPCFEDLLHDLDWVRQIFKALERSRNVIMHSGQLSMDDIERVGVFIRDWLRQIGA
jgi:hypothetical protein